MVSAAVPAVVGNAMTGTDLCLVFATPSSETTSANSGLLVIIPTAFAVSIEEPPPTATIKSAPLFLNASTPFFTLVTVGLGFMSLNISKGTFASSRTSVTIFVTPNLIKLASDTTSAFFSPRRLTSTARFLRAPGPK